MAKRAKKADVSIHGSGTVIRYYSKGRELEAAARADGWNALWTRSNQTAFPDQWVKSDQSKPAFSPGKGIWIDPNGQRIAKISWPDFK